MTVSLLRLKLFGRLKFVGGMVWLLSALIVPLRAADPGLPLTSTEISDNKTGSVLLYPLFTSSATTPNSVNTRISLINTSVTSFVFVRMLFVDGQSGAVVSQTICLIPNQTTTFMTSDVDPGVRGYVIAVAIDSNGCPINFNFLAGFGAVKLATGHTATLPALGVNAIAATPATCNTSSLATTLTFDGTSYERLPRTLALDKLRSPADGNSTLLAVNRLGGNLATGAPSTVGTLNGELINDLGTGLPFNVTETLPQLFTTLSDSFPLTSPVFSSVVTTGRTGWLTIYNTATAGLWGALINFNPSASTSATAFRSGHNLRQLTLNTTDSVVIPVQPPSC